MLRRGRFENFTLQRKEQRQNMDADREHRELDGVRHLRGIAAPGNDQHGVRKHVGQPEHDGRQPEDERRPRRTAPADAREELALREQEEEHRRAAPTV